MTNRLMQFRFSHGIGKLPTVKDYALLEIIFFLKNISFSLYKFLKYFAVHGSSLYYTNILFLQNKDTPW